MAKTADNYEMVCRYKRAIMDVNDQITALRERLSEEGYRVEFPDEAATVTDGDVLAMEAVAGILANLCPMRAVRIKGEFLHRDERDPEKLKRAAVYGKEKCDAFFGPGVCDEYFV